MPALSASAPGKTILFGEHAVVYGHPAIAVPLLDITLKVIVQPLPNENKIHIINKGLNEDFLFDEEEHETPYSLALDAIKKHLKIDRLPAMQLTISSTISPASGLGSSAAFAVAMTKAVTSFLGYRLTLEIINDIAFEIEKNQHGTPSGIDNTVVNYQKPVYFRRGQTVEFVSVGEPMTLILANSGIQTLTKEAISQIKEKRITDTGFVDHIFDQIGSITKNARSKIEMGDQESIGQLMLKNHQLLKELGLSLVILDDLVETSIQSGAYGAKLCGSGKGGNVVALVPSDKIKIIEKALIETGAHTCLLSTIASTKGGL